MLNIQFRQGRKEDALAIAALDYKASAGAGEYLFHGLVPGLSSVEIIAHGLENDSYPYVCESAIVAEEKGKIVGMALSFPARYHCISDEMRSFFPAERLERFQAFFSARVEGSYFIDALAVEEDLQKTGIGSQLVTLTKQKALEEGYSELSLIVFADNFNAQRLYRKHGFKTVRNIELEPHPLIPHIGGCFLMNSQLATRDFQ